MSKDPSFNWKEQSFADDCEHIECPPYDEYKDFRLDPSGHYVLIRINRQEDVIEVGVCDKDHRIVAVFRGATCQELYHTILKYEKDKGLAWFTEKDHIAYLGKEFKKAEIALTGNGEYVQE